MRAGEVAIIAVCTIIGVALCVGSRKLAEQEKRLFTVTVPLPVWVLTARNCILGISIVAFGIFSRNKVFQSLDATRTCPDRGANIFALTVGLVLTVAGIVTYRIRKRQDAALATADAARALRARAVPPHVRVVRLTKEEQYPDQPPATTAIVLAVNGIVLALIGILALTGTFCTVALLR